MSASSIFVSLFESAPRLIRMTLDLFWMYLTLGWRVRKTRRAFEKQLIKQGMSKVDAKRLSACFEELKEGLLFSMKHGVSFGSRQGLRKAKLVD